MKYLKLVSVDRSIVHQVKPPILSSREDGGMVIKQYQWMARGQLQPSEPCDRTINGRGRSEA